MQIQVVIPKLRLVQVAALNDATFEAFVQDLWREVGSIEGSEEVPRLQIETTFIDIGPFS